MLAAHRGAAAGAGILTRLGVIVRHRAIGWAANAMVVWDAARGRRSPRPVAALAALPGVTLCYQRRTVPGSGAYRAVLDDPRPQPGRGAGGSGHRRAPCRHWPAADHRVLFSTRCFKQTGALLAEAAHETRDPLPPMRWTPPTARILNALQDGFPLDPTPLCRRWRGAGPDRGRADRPHRRRCARSAPSPVSARSSMPRRWAGPSACAPWRCPPTRFDAVVTLVNAHPEVAHNYERAHRLNMWFVLACERPERIETGGGADRGGDRAEGAAFSEMNRSFSSASGCRHDHRRHRPPDHRRHPGRPAADARALCRGGAAGWA